MMNSRSVPLATAILVLLTRNTQARIATEESTCFFDDDCHHGHDGSATSSSLLQVARGERKAKFWPFTQEDPAAADVSDSSSKEQTTQTVTAASSTQEQAPKEAAVVGSSPLEQALPATSTADSLAKGGWGMGEDPSGFVDPSGHLRATPEASSAVSFAQKQAPHEAAPEGTHHQQAPAPCWYASHGKCWYLSEIGANCSATCAKAGRRFSYAIGNIDEPLIPWLVGHEPVEKQKPWAPLECYVSDEDRFHPANANSAKHVNETEASTWHHESCKLACPCHAENTHCTWKPAAACVPDFHWNGALYSGCAGIDAFHERPWCQHQDQHLEGGSRGDAGGLTRPQDWSYCSEICDAETLPIPSEPVATPKAEETKAEDSWVVSKAEEDELCSWQRKPECSKSFEYKGVVYNGTCATIDNPTPWCSHDSIHDGLWSSCERICMSPPATTTITTSVPRVVTPAGDPCAGPDFSDAIGAVGASVTIGEEGYKIVASTHSLPGMKRFICRTVEKIKCRVVDLPSLMAFIPYEMASRKTYAHLESDLTVLCHARDAWVVPQTIVQSSTPSPTTTTTTLAPTHPPATDPCTVDQNDRDLVGGTAALDEDGFKIINAAGKAVSEDRRAANMKRFICRIVAKIDCQVADPASLTTFVPYKMANQDTYAHLESELTVLCLARQAWVVPRTGPLRIGTAAPAAQPARELAASDQVAQADDPCAASTSVHDKLGASATLDEVGYKLIASTGSASDMTRFVCRTVSKLDCRVKSLWGLKAFAPDHSGFVSHESYDHLESELTTLCHAGGQWVEPH